MRGSRSFLIMLVIAVAVGGYAYYDSKHDVTDTTATKAKVFTVPPGKIEELEIDSTTGAVTKAKKNGDAWTITAPESIDADAAAIGGVASTLESLEEQRVVDEHPSSTTAFGLSPARFSLSFKANGDPAPHRLNIGNKTPAGSDLYAQVEGQPKVFLIGAYVEDSLNKSTFDLRDKTALKFPRESVDSLTIDATGAPSVALAKKGNDWMLTKPVEAKADFGSVDGVIGRIAPAVMKSIVAPGSRPVPAPPKPGDKKDEATVAKKDDAKKDASKKETAKPEPPPDIKPGSTAYSEADLKAYGLDKPQVVVTVGAGSTRASMAIGGRFDDTSVYARDLSRPIIFTVDKGLADDVKKKADDLRLKDIFEFRGFSATTVELTYAGSTLTFEKQKTAAKDPAAATTDIWKQTKPVAKDVDQTKLNDLLTTLSNLRADKFADKPLASGEDLGVFARFSDGGNTKDERLTLRKSGTTVQAIHAGEASPAIVPTADFDKALVLVKDLFGKK